MSIFYDVIYVIQHYILYTKRETKEEIEEEAKHWKLEHLNIKGKYQSMPKNTDSILSSEVGALPTIEESSIELIGKEVA